nr:hypothetical protein [Brevibacillus laterosporus]
MKCNICGIQFTSDKIYWAHNELYHETVELEPKKNTRSSKTKIGQKDSSRNEVK